MQDRFEGMASGVDAPITHGFAVTPADDVDLSEITRAVYVGAGGTLAATLMTGAVVTFEGLAGGTLLPVRIRRVHATGTSATAILGLV